jgi:hypothetical protein
MWDETVSSIGFVLNQTRANRIPTNVSELLGQTFVVTKAMIEKISLPLHAAELRSNSFEVANQLRKRVAPINPEQRANGPASAVEDPGSSGRVHDKFAPYQKAP